MHGNDRYVSGVETPNSFKTTGAALTLGQNPYACILGCADSRVSPELCFDENQGDLFVTRIAGNFVTTEILASLEYGTVLLQFPLIMVLGHTMCLDMPHASTSLTTFLDSAKQPHFSHTKWLKGDSWWLADYMISTPGVLKSLMHSFIDAAYQFDL